MCMCMDKVTFEQYHRLMILFNITVESKLNVTLEASCKAVQFNFNVYSIKYSSVSCTAIQVMMDLSSSCDRILFVLLHCC